ncbi:MAG: energy-coupling factor transporter ATPase [candidate division Zixibacteria bacterium]|nr:energy-coupling factor transporter ATPase [candidate division Zixibacteria bacterium]
MIKFDHVTYIYPDGTKAIDDLTLTIASGERVALIGNNGSGKTTFALLINGILKPTSGEIRVCGLDPSVEQDSRHLKQIVGMVFQNPDNQLVSTTVEREVAFSLENLNVEQPKIAERVDRSLEFFGLSHMHRWLTSGLSGGEKQKLALAAVMISEPEILVLDEPGSYLDESGKKLLGAAVRKLLEHKSDLTVLRITQYDYVAEEYGRVIVFREGGVLADGSPQEIFSQVALCLSVGLDVPLRYRIKAEIGFPKDKPMVESINQGLAEKPKGISLKSVWFTYGNRKDNALFQGINLSIESNCIYGLVGCSGSGKSTLIQLLAGLLKPDKGTVQYSNFKPGPGAVAISFQHPERQFFLPTVDREIKFAAENLHLPEIDALADDSYRLIGLTREKFAGRDPFTLSGGEKRRLAFGTILSLTPAFIFFDEPTCGLDADGVARFVEMVGKLRSKGIGIIIISHYGNIILQLTDRIIALKDGAIECMTGKKDFFRWHDYSAYLSCPEIISYQNEQLGKWRFLTESELASIIT